MAARGIGLAAALVALVLLAAAPAAGHQPSDSYLVVDADGGAIGGRWSIALRDLDAALGLDANDDALLTWGEVAPRLPAITAYAFAHLRLSVGGVPCRPEPLPALVERLTAGTFLVLPFTTDCRPQQGPLAVDYRLLFDLDRQHRGLLQVRSAAGVDAAVLAPERPLWRQPRDGGGGGWRSLAMFVGDGVRHIVFGFDHLLFLVTLLLPAVLTGDARSGWRPVARPRSAVLTVVKLVTAFTLAHSLTLGLASVGWLNLAPRIVEPLIALSIVFTAVNNLWAIVRRRLWLVAFGFGLVHGIGFADALKDLGLPRADLLLPLFGFNLGVELGQLALVAVVLPLALALRRQRLYQPLVLRLGSLLIAAVASLWLIERASGVWLLV